MPIEKTFEKESREKLLYEFDWTDQLDGSSISSSTWYFPSGIVDSDDSKGTTYTRVRVYSGTYPDKYIGTNIIIDTNNNTMVRSAYWKIVER